MIKILENVDLTKFNTFGIKANAKYFFELKNEEDIKELFETKEFKNNRKLFLGGGSNILITQDFDGIVVLNRLKGIQIIKEDNENVWIKSMGGELWDDLVNFTVDKGYWGIENMALIPGTVGAGPVQNIGAYGTELKDVIENVEVYDIETGEVRIFTKAECEFEYRGSVFKNKLKGKYFISAVVLKLNKKELKNIKYKALQEYLNKNNIEVKNPKDISNIVSEIRRSKLPDPKVLGSAGSFFKNVYVDKKKLEGLKKEYGDIPSFKEDEMIKIPAGWLIEQCGPLQDGVSWKGYKEGCVGVYEKQALVLVNYGGATGEEIKNLAFKIMDSVYQKFGLKLTPEVNLI